mgnify:CR=1 FL=1
MGLDAGDPERASLGPRRCLPEAGRPVAAHGEDQRPIGRELREGDAAGHAYRGMTPRNRSLFLRRGHAYVYIAYGTSMMLNVAGSRHGVGEGVLRPKNFRSRFRPTRVLDCPD